jgi:hypothetical protein
MNPVPVRFVGISEGTDPIFLTRIRGLRFFLWRIGFWVPIRRLPILKEYFGSSFFFMDPSRWTYHFDVVVFSDPRSLLFYFHVDPDAVLIIFLCGVTIGVLDPDWIFYDSFRSETPLLNLCVAHFLYGVGIRTFSLDPQSIVFLFGSVPSYSHGSALFFYNNRNICFY